MKQVKLLIIYSLIFQFSFGQSTIKDDKYKGWRGLTWESTESDVLKKYGSQMIILPTAKKFGIDNQLYCPFEIHDYELGFDTFIVYFLFDLKTKKLFQVNVQKDNPIDIQTSVQDLEIGLTEKYGKPIIKEETPKYISKWLFSELNVTLTYSDIKVGKTQIMKTIFLSYQKPDKTKLENF